MVGVLLAVVDEECADNADLTQFVLRLYKAFNHNGCRVVLATPGGAGLTMVKDVAPAFEGVLKFPVDLDEMEERHFSHYQLLCVLSCNPPRVRVAGSGKGDVLAGVFSKNGRPVSFVHPQGAAFMPPCTQVCDISAVQKNLSTPMDEDGLQKFIAEVKHCLACEQKTSA